MKKKNNKSDIPAKPARKSPVRKVWGRRRVDVPGREGIYIFEMTKEGVAFRRKATRLKSAVKLPWEKLAACGAGVESGGYRFALTEQGVEVSKGSKSYAVPFSKLVNNVQSGRTFSLAGPLRLQAGRERGGGVTLRDLIDDAQRLLDQGADPGARVCVDVEHDKVRKYSRGDGPDEVSVYIGVDRLERENSSLNYGVKVVLS